MSITLENGRINLDSLVTIEDHLKFTNASYVKDSIKVIKGKIHLQ